MREVDRIPFGRFMNRVEGVFMVPRLLHAGGPLTVDKAMELHATTGLPCDEPEGVVYRLERKKKVDILAKWVRPDKVDGKYLPEISGRPAVWNWRP